MAGGYCSRPHVRPLQPELDALVQEQRDFKAQINAIIAMSTGPIEAQIHESWNKQRKCFADRIQETSQCNNTSAQQATNELANDHDTSSPFYDANSSPGLQLSRSGDLEVNGEKVL